MPVISITNIQKSIAYGFCKRKKIITNLSLEVEQGEVFGFIGPNGAGKSTVINMIMGFTTPDLGTITIDEQAPVDSQARKQLGFLPENARYYDHLTPDELLRFGGRVSGMSQRDVTHAIPEILARVDLLVERHRQLSTFSKGMKQRIGIALALIHDPLILIFDEPMSGLDPLGRSLLKDIILEEKKRGKTVFFSTHILNDVEALCDRLAVLHRGDVLYRGSVSSFMAGEKDLESKFVKMINSCEDANK